MVAQPGGKLEADDDEIEEGDEGDRAEHHPGYHRWPSELRCLSTTSIREAFGYIKR
jgi:hypothetical protein